MSGNEWEQGLAYVKKLHEELHTDDEIRQIMLEGDWEEEQIEQLLTRKRPAAGPATAAPASRRRPPRPARVSRAAIMVVAVLALAAAGAAIWRLLPRGPEHTVAQYMAAAEARDEKRVRALLSTKTRKRNDEFVAKQKAMFAAGGVRPSEEFEDRWAHHSADLAAHLCEKVDRVGVAEINGERATVPFTVKGQSFKMYFHLIKEDGRWKIASGADCR